MATANSVSVQITGDSASLEAALTRAGKKSECPIEDLKKAQWYLGREISNLEKNK